MAAVASVLEPVPCAIRLPRVNSGTEDLPSARPRLLERVLQLTGGNRTHAAHRLGLTPRTIFAKIKKYQLTLPARGL